MAYLHSDREQFRDAIDLAYEQTGVMVQAIEKDYYVTMLLRLLAQRMPYIVFKGGTSLSKCHKVIRRFSEDIDITIDTLLSQGQKKKIKQAIVESAEELGMTIENLDETRSRRDYNRYVIAYDSVIPMLEEGFSKTVAHIEELKTDIKSLRESLKPQKAEIKQTEKEIAKLEAKKAAAEAKAAEKAKKTEAESVVKKLLASGVSADEILEKLK